MQSRVHQIDHLDLRLVQKAWSFALQNRQAIDDHWKKVMERNPALWNGRVFMCSRCEATNGRFSGDFFESDFASFVALRDWGWPDRSTFNCFGSAAILSNDGAVLMGRMSAHTLNGGKVYPPGGSLEPRDLKPNGTIDILGSIEKELEEETGLKAHEAQAVGVIAVHDEQRVSIAQGLRFPMTAAEIVIAAEKHWQGQVEPELDGLVMLRDSSQLDSSMPNYAKDIAMYFLEHSAN